MKKLLVVLPLVALLFSWGHYGAQQVEAPPAVGLSIEVVAAGCDTAGGSTTCYVPVSTQFTVTMNVDVLPPSTGNYIGFQGYLTHTAGLTWVDRVGAPPPEIVWPDGAIGVEASGAGWYKAGDMTAVIPPFPWSVHIGPVLEVDYTCGASPSSETVTMVHGSPNNTYLLDSNNQPAAEAGSETLTINCQAPPDLSIEVVTAGCDTAGGPTTCYVPVNTQFTVTMNVDVLPPSTGDYKLFQAYLTHTGGLTWVDRPGTAEIVWPDSELPAEFPGAGYYLAGDTIIMRPPSTHIGAILEVDYDCGASPSTETVTMVHGYSSNTFLLDSLNQPAVEAGSESLTINCQGPPPTEIKWVQWPDEDLTGLDVGTLVGFPLVLAEDFQCTQSGLITEIDFWASWYWDEPPLDDPNLVGFTLSLHSDVPAGEDLPWSHPGELLWEFWFDPYQCIVEAWAFGVEEGWFDPAIGYYGEFADTQIWFYQCPIPEPYWFQQEKDTIYWLDIQAVPIEPGFFWGWKTSIDHWNDAVVWAEGPEPVDPLSWFDLWYPPGHPLFHNPIDLAFQIWGQECNPLLDSDADTFYDDVECYLPTDFRDDCPDWTGTTGLCPGPTCDGHDAWPLDNSVDKILTAVGDVLPYSGKMQWTVAEHPEVQRLDLDASGIITAVGDVLNYQYKMQVTCT